MARLLPTEQEQRKTLCKEYFLMDECIKRSMRNMILEGRNENIEKRCVLCSEFHKTYDDLMKFVCKVSQENPVDLPFLVWANLLVCCRIIEDEGKYLLSDETTDAIHTVMDMVQDEIEENEF